MKRSTVTLLALGVGVLALGWGAIATSRGFPATLPRHLLLYVGAGIAWAAALLALPLIPPARGQLAVVWAVALALRAPAWFAPPAHSDDSWRFLWDGRVQRAGENPYLHAPDDPALAALRDDDFQRINHRNLPTIYPPAAQLLFRAAAALPLPPRIAWKLVVLAFDLAVVALLIVWLRRLSGDPRRALAWAWSPLVAIELSQNAHLDGPAIACLVGALALAPHRRLAAGILLGLATGMKLVSAPLVPAWRSFSFTLAFALTLALVTLPYASAGLHLTGSLGEYGRRWRAGDGAFAVLSSGATVVVAHSRFARRADLSGSPRLARFITGRDRDQVYPDEVANLLARAAAFVLFLGALALALKRRLPPERVTSVALGAFLLLTPTLHPWYVLWIVPLLATSASPAWLWLAALAPLNYWPLRDYLAGAGWHDPAWTRACLHGGAWVLLLTRLRAPVKLGDS